MMSKKDYYKLLFMVVIVIALSIYGAIKIPQWTNAVNERLIEESIDDSYIFYIDGKEVNRDNIDLSQYKIMIDHDRKAVYMTGK